VSLGTRPLRVLVVDDEPAIRRFLKPSLTHAGYVVSEAEAGQAAIDAARRGGADLIVLGSRRLSLAGGLLLGSVAIGVVKHSGRPVLMARDPAHQLRRGTP